MFKKSNDLKAIKMKILFIFNQYTKHLVGIKNLFIFNAIRCMFKHSSYYIFSVCFCCPVTGCHDISVCKNINILNKRLFKSWSVLRGITETGRELFSLVTDVNLYPPFKIYFNVIDIGFNNLTKLLEQCEWSVTPLINSKLTMLKN